MGGRYWELPGDEIRRQTRGGDNLWADVRVIPKEMSYMRGGQFGLSPLSGAYSRNIVCRFILVSLKIDAILGNVTFRQCGRKFEQLKGGNGLSNTHSAALTLLEITSNHSVLPYLCPFPILSPVSCLSHLSLLFSKEEERVT